jgi:hypothetical protein
MTWPPLSEANSLIATSFFKSGGVWAPMMFYGVPNDAHMAPPYRILLPTSYQN